MKWGPTSANSSPARLLFLRSRPAKERLAPALAPQNVEKTLQAPVTAIVAHDLRFYDELPRLFPHVDARSWFVGNEPLVDATALRNGSLQAALAPFRPATWGPERRSNEDCCSDRANPARDHLRRVRAEWLPSVPSAARDATSGHRFLRRPGGELLHASDALRHAAGPRLPVAARHV